MTWKKTEMPYSKNLDNGQINISNALEKWKCTLATTLAMGALMSARGILASAMGQLMSAVRQLESCSQQQKYVVTIGGCKWAYNI
jgi:hypothetical protein